MYRLHLTYLWTCCSMVASFRCIMSDGFMSGLLFSKCGCKYKLFLRYDAFLR